MKTYTIPYIETGYFSKTACDYLSQAKEINSFYGNYPDLEGFKKQIKLKQSSFGAQSRNLLVEVLETQYQDLKISKTIGQNIQSLLEDNTFTITTGHQLNLFTGPLYFLYKIFSTINLCEKLKKEFPKLNFVPIYWMATEDHDFEEINFFNFNQKKIAWNRNSKSAVGRIYRRFKSDL